MTDLNFEADPNFGIDVKGTDAQILESSTENGKIIISTSDMPVPPALVPLPATFPLMISGLALLGFKVRKQEVKAI